MDGRSTVSAGTHQRIQDGWPISNALDKAWLDLCEFYPGKRSDVMLDVRLSAAHVFVGFMELPAAEANTTPRYAMQGIAETWANHVWQLAPGEWITRWQKLTPTGAFLVSSANRSVHEAILSFAKGNRLHLRSCLPASLSRQHVQSMLSSPAVTRRQDSGTADALILWTELLSSGRRASQVQIFRWSNGSPSAIWRGWIPPQDNIEKEDIALKGAIRRFVMSSGNLVDITIHRSSWPTAADALSPTSEA